jgi:hypothetical protein
MTLLFCHSLNLVVLSDSINWLHDFLAISDSEALIFKYTRCMYVHDANIQQREDTTSKSTLERRLCVTETSYWMRALWSEL